MDTGRGHVSDIVTVGGVVGFYVGSVFGVIGVVGGVFGVIGVVGVVGVVVDVSGCGVIVGNGSGRIMWDVYTISERKIINYYYARNNVWKIECIQ